MSNTVKALIKDNNTVEIVLANGVSVDPNKPLSPSTLEVIAAIYRREEEQSAQGGCIARGGCAIEW
jgi:hypothetical protein